MEERKSSDLPASRFFQSLLAKKYTVAQDKRVTEQSLEAQNEIYKTPFFFGRRHIYQIYQVNKIGIMSQSRKMVKTINKNCPQGTTVKGILEVDQKYLLVLFDQTKNAIVYSLKNFQYLFEVQTRFITYYPFKFKRDHSFIFQSWDKIFYKYNISNQERYPFLLNNENLEYHNLHFVKKVNNSITVLCNDHDILACEFNKFRQDLALKEVTSFQDLYIVNMFKVNSEWVGLRGLLGGKQMVKGLNVRSKQEYILDFCVEERQPQIRSDLMQNFRDSLFFADNGRLFVFNMFSGQATGLHDFGAFLGQEEFVSHIAFKKMWNKVVFIVETVRVTEGPARSAVMRMHRFVLRVKK